MAEKYIITNGCEYVKRRKNDYPSILLDAIGATKFTHQEAQKYISRHFKKSDKPWGMRRVCKKGTDGKVFIITTGTSYVTNIGNGITTSFKKAKRFNSVADATAYIHKNKGVFDTPFIISESGKSAQEPDIKVFSDEQLRILGLADDPAFQKHHREAIPKTMKERVYEKSGGRCAICGKPLRIEEATIDHIVPVSRGGENKFENYQLACKECNQLKSNRKDDEFAAGLANILSIKLQETDNQNISDMLIRSIVRGKISTMFPEVYPA